MCRFDVRVLVLIFNQQTEVMWETAPWIPIYAGNSDQALFYTRHQLLDINSMVERQKGYICSQI